MAKQSNLLLYVLIILCPFHASQILGHTDELDIIGLQRFYKRIGQPPQLSMWRAKGGDPCLDHWIGVECERSAVISLKLHGLKLSGNLSNGLFLLKNLTRLDLSSNKFVNRIPHYLPPKVTSLNLADNRLSSSIPETFASMKHLRRLNLSHNLLDGNLDGVFDRLEYLTEMDLSYNSFSGDLPSSFEATNLCRLFLQNNEFTGTLIYLEYLTLIDLNIENNYFSGIIPTSFRKIDDIRIGGNEGLPFFVAQREEGESEEIEARLTIYAFGMGLIFLCTMTLEGCLLVLPLDKFEKSTINYVHSFCLAFLFLLALIEVYKCVIFICAILERGFTFF